jgi:selenocysteine-specific elongation factor
LSTAEDSPSEVDSPSLHVVATAGHVDHGKSSLVLRLTGMDPDRLAEEKRRGLTIDLGFAWTTLPSGREIGFVDVPGHERFVRNMLAGVGPVRLVLFVVAADEGWKPQSEEHLQIVDVLGCDGAVVAVTKMDLVDRETLDRRTNEFKARIDGTRLSGASIVCCSATTGEGIERLRTALDQMAGAAPPPDRTARPRQFIDRVFTIKGAGTVVTGTLTGGPVAVGQEAEILPSGHRARIRGLQTHKRPLEVAHPVSRVAVNLAGTPKTELERGDVLTLPGRWRAASVFEGTIRTVRGLGHPLTSRGAFKFYAGSAERDARIRFYGRSELQPGEQAYARITLSRPVVLDFRDGFVLREAGRQETVAGGEVLDTDPPARSQQDPIARLDARRDADRAALAWRIVADRGAIRASELKLLAGVEPDQAEHHGALRLESWILSPQLLGRVTSTLVQVLEAFHSEHPLRPGMDIGESRLVLFDMGAGHSDPGLTDAVLEHLVRTGAIVRDGSVLRLARHHLSTRGREDADRLVDAVERAEPTPPSMKELMGAGFDRELIQAACSEGRLVRVSADIVVTPAFLAKAESVVREHAAGVTVSAFREAIGTTRKYALPLLEYFDQRGITRREGDVRVMKD